MSNFLFTLPFFLVAVIIHEVSHGWVAYKLGDPTAKYSGRLTLNPLAHIDPVGTIILPLLLVVVHSPFIFGWAKPVPINFWNLRHPRRDLILVGLAGPLANFILAFLLSWFLKLNLPPFLVVILSTAILLNLVLGVFNLIPVPPLDGSRIVSGLIPSKYAVMYNRLEQVGIVLIILLLSLGVLDRIIWPLVNYLSHLLGVSLSV